MAARLSLLLPLMLVAYFSCMMVEEASASWWSLGVTSCAVQSSGTCENCAQLQNMNVLSEDQRSLCVEDANPVQAIAKGTRRAIIECQKRFSNSIWNCSTFVGENLFGSFVVEKHTRETAVLYGFLTAGAVQAVAEACQEQRIPGCPCIREPLESPDSKGNIIFADCNDQTEWARDYVDTFVFPGNLTELGGATDKHNIDLGGGLISDSNASMSCSCHGLSGSCSVQTCYKKAAEVGEIGENLQTKYGGAVKVVLSENGTLIRDPTINPNADPLKPTDLAYIDNSPDFCDPSPSDGILGTVDRDCDPSLDSPNSCAVLCCGRGYYTKTITEPVTKCEFVYCCEIVCRQTGTKTTTQYKCNP